MATQEIEARSNNAAQLGELTARVAALATAELCLYQQGFAPSATSTVADLNAAEADFTGYARETVGPFAAAGLDVDGGVVSYGLSAVFARTAGATSNTIAGAYLVDPGTPDVLIAVFQFQSVIGMNIPGDQIQIQLALREPGNDSIRVDN